MSILKYVFVLTLFAFIFGSCSSGKGSSVKKGDIIIVLEEIRERAETQWEDASYTDGFISMIPAGTKMEVLYTPAPAAQVFECRPIEVNGLKDAESVEAFFVPEPIRYKEGYTSYSFALQISFIGTKVKKEHKDQ